MMASALCLHLPGHATTTGTTKASTSPGLLGVMDKLTSLYEAALREVLG